MTSPANCDDKNDIKEQLLNGEVHHHYNHHLHTHNLQQHLNHQQPSPNRLKDTNKNSANQFHHEQHIQQLQHQQLTLQQSFDQVGYDQSNLNMDQLQFTTLLQQQQQQQQQQQPSSIDSPMSNPYDLRTSGLPSQYLLPQQLGTFNTAPHQYYQDPYTLGIPIQASAYMQPTYYGMAPTHNLLYHQIQQQQVQQLGSSPGTLTSLTNQNSSISKQNGRPATPQQQQQNSQDQNQMNPYAQQSSFSYYPPGPYTAFDPTGGASAAQLMMSNSRNLNSNVRLISPMLINANANQSKLALLFNKKPSSNFFHNRFHSKQ